MSMFKDRVLLFLECINIAMRDTQSELRKIREEKEIQTTLLRRIAENQTSANKETNKAKEAAPALKAITWREAVLTLRNICAGMAGCDCHPERCPMYRYCERYLQGGGVPCSWEVPGYE